MGKTLDHGKLVAYAHAQIQAAQDICQHHHPSHLGLCNCGRPPPCAVVTACLTTIAHYRATLAIIGATVPLPIIAPSPRAGVNDRPPGIDKHR